MRESVAYMGSKLPEFIVYLLQMADFKKTIMDIGTGDGRFVYKNAAANPDILYIGIDPSNQMEAYIKKANRKHLKNVRFITASVENLPQEFENSIDEINIILPWGTLLQYTVTADHTILRQIRNLLKQSGILKMVLGYAQETEPNETERLGLPEINGEQIKNVITPQYENSGFMLKSWHPLERRELKNFETTWCKKLAFGKLRPLFYLEFASSAVYSKEEILAWKSEF